MNNWFYFLALGISTIFGFVFAIIFFCSLKIYLNISNMMRKDKDEYHE